MMFKRYGCMLIVTALSLLAAVLFLPVLLDPVESIIGAPQTDGLSMFYPLRAFANQELQSGRLPLWNPFVLCGHPFHAEGQGAVFYPLNLLLAWLPAPLALNLFALFHLAFAGIFFFLFMRSTGTSPAASMFAAVVYMLSSGPVSRLYAGHFTIIPFLALLPALLWAWQMWCSTKAWAAIATGGAAIGCMILAGYPQLVLYGTMYLSWLVLVEFLRAWRKQGIGQSKSPLIFLVMVVVIGAALGAIQLLPSYAFAGKSFRQVASYEFIATFSFHPENLITLLTPRIFGDLGGVDLPYWGRDYLWEMWVYVGIVPLSLALMASLTTRNRIIAQHGSAALVFMILALGRHTPLHRFLYDYFPLFNYFRGSSKFSFFALLSIITLSGVGFDTLLYNESSKSGKQLKVFAGCLALFALIGGILFFLLQPGRGELLNRIIAWRVKQAAIYVMPYGQPSIQVDEVWAHIEPQLLGLIGLCLGGLLVVVLWKYLRIWGPVLLAALMLCDLVPFVMREFPSSPVSLAAVNPEFLHVLKNDRSHSRVIATPYARNALVPYRMETALGYVGNMTARYNNFLTATAGLPRDMSMASQLTLSSRYFYPAVRHLLLDERQNLPAQAGTQIVRADRRILYRLNNAMQRIYFSRRGAFYSSQVKALKAVEDGKVDFSDYDLIEIDGTPPQFYPPETGDEAEIESMKPSEVIVRTKTFGPRLLVLSDSFESNWTCRIDGEKETTIYPVNIAFRAVQVPAGEHEVAFTYEPRSFYVGAIITLATLAALFMVAILRKFRRVRTDRLGS